MLGPLPVWAVHVHAFVQPATCRCARDTRTGGSRILFTAPVNKVQQQAHRIHVQVLDKERTARMHSLLYPMHMDPATLGPMVLQQLRRLCARDQLRQVQLALPPAPADNSGASAAAQSDASNPSAAAEAAQEKDRRDAQQNERGPDRPTAVPVVQQSRHALQSSSHAGAAWRSYWRS